MSETGGERKREEGIRPLTEGEFEQIRRLAREKFGLDLRKGKEQLVAARLGKKLRASAFRTFREYYNHVIRDRTGEALAEMIDALTTNYTSFLREPAHFDFLRQIILPELKHRRRIDIWSAACASGEEAYSLAFCVLEELDAHSAQEVRILATDISTRALATAEKAIYPADRLEAVPRHWRARYLLKGEGRWQGWFRIKPEVRSLVEFRRLNLAEPLPPLPRFPVIFCRNVMIYLDKDKQEELVRRLSACLEPGGYLLTGHSESLLGANHALEYVRPAVYRKPGSGRPAPGASRCGR